MTEKTVPDTTQSSSQLEGNSTAVSDFDNLKNHAQADALMTLKTDLTVWQFQQLPSKALWQMRIKMFVRSLFMGILMVLLPFAVIKFLQVDLAGGNLFFVCLTISWLVFSIVSWFTTTFEYRYTAYHLDNAGLIIRKGMFWRSETFALRTRVQHIDVVQSPIDSLFGLATIKVYTAGTKLGSISLSGLYKADAERIRDELINTDTDTL